MDLYRKVRLACAEGMSQREAARHFGISRLRVVSCKAMPANCAFLTFERCATSNILGSKPEFAASDMNVACRSANVSGSTGRAKDQEFDLCGRRLVSCGTTAGVCRGSIGQLRADFVEKVGLELGVY